MPDREVDSAHSFDEVLVALVWGAASSVAAFFLPILLSVPIGVVLRQMGLLSDEGSAWLGVGIGIPCGVVAAIVAFFLTVRWKLKRGGPR